MPKIALLLACLASVRHGRRVPIQGLRSNPEAESQILKADQSAAFNPSFAGARPVASSISANPLRSPVEAQSPVVAHSASRHSGTAKRMPIPAMRDMEIKAQSSVSNMAPSLELNLHGSEGSSDTSSAKVQSSASKAGGQMWWWSKVLAARWAMMAGLATVFCKFGPLKGARSGQIIANAATRDPALVDPRDFTIEERNYFLNRPQSESRRERFIKKGYGSLALILGTAVSLWLANSSGAEGYIGFWDKVVGWGQPHQHLKMSIRNWVNEAMMAFFFFGVGLEIKNEVLFGSLRSLKQAALPCVAALGGMLMPAFLYILVQAGSGASLAGWAVPMATDIAFAMGIYNLFRNKMPAGAAAFLLTLATVDDLGAIAVIAVAFAKHINLFFLLNGVFCLVLFEIMRKNRVRNSTAWLGTGVALWYCLLRGGVNADIAGVIAAFFVPTVAAPRWTKAPGALPNLIDHYVHYWLGWANFLIMPLFAIANTAVSLTGVGASMASSPVAKGILLGLLLGKPLGIAGISWMSIEAGFCKLPTGMRLVHLLICGLLGGIAFTMSLFLIEQSLTGSAVMFAKLAVIGGSTIAALVAAVLMYVRKPFSQEEDAEPLVPAAAAPAPPPSAALDPQEDRMPSWMKKPDESPSTAAPDAPEDESPSTAAPDAPEDESPSTAAPSSREDEFDEWLKRNRPQ